MFSIYFWGSVALREPRGSLRVSETVYGTWPPGSDALQRSTVFLRCFVPVLRWRAAPPRWSMYCNVSGHGRPLGDSQPAIQPARCARGFLCRWVPHQAHRPAESAKPSKGQIVDWCLWAPLTKQNHSASAGGSYYRCMSPLTAHRSPRHLCPARWPSKVAAPGASFAGIQAASGLDGPAPRRRPIYGSRAPPRVSEEERELHSPAPGCILGRRDSIAEPLTVSNISKSVTLRELTEAVAATLPVLQL